MKNLFIIFSLILFAIGAKGEGKDHVAYNHALASYVALTGSGSLDIDPTVDLNLCTGSGIIDLNFSQGIGDVILWDDGSDDIIREGLGDGEYIVNLTIDGCDTTLFFNLELPDLLTATVVNASNKNCVTGTASNPVLGSFNVNVTGGEGPYIYSMNNQPFQTSNEFNNLEEGTYIVDVTDANGCQTQVVQEIKCIGCRISGNPVQKDDQFFVDVFFGDSSETAELSIYNSNGRRVKDIIDVPVINGEVNAFPVTADLDAGMYIVLIIGDSISFSRQLIVID